MKLLKNIVYYGIIIFSLWFMWHTFTKTPCDRIIEYDISYDDRFRITETQFLSFVERAEIPWEEAAGKELFRYSPGADFKINLIFSEEQERLYEGNDISANLDQQQADLDSLQTRYQSAVRRYETSLRQYESQVQSYESEVEYWNNQGGAPTETYNKLQNDAQRLDSKYQEVERLRANVNKLAEENNQEIQAYNEGVGDFNELFRDPKQFDAGNTDGTEINIYSYDGNQELMTLIMHEFGHVLGIDHVEDESAVMYYLLNDRNKGGELAQADIDALNLSCKLQ
ncbi:MAG: matrixin family metalloprotease [Candidatus Pacebacteria bacterium]|nr:matrixin family metalloprotease [Candidatus Paceibacterota bacterium]